jgi:hypothetical protein
MERPKISPMFPFSMNYGEGDVQFFGISKREYIVTQLLTALIAKNTNNSFRFLVDIALEMADELIEKMEIQQDNVEDKHNDG